VSPSPSLSVSLWPPHRPLCVRRAAFPPPCSLTPSPSFSPPPLPSLPPTPSHPQRIGSISLAYIPPISRPLSPLYPVLLSIPPSAHKCVRPFRSTPHQVGSVPPHCRGCLPPPLVSASCLLFPLPPFFVPPPMPPILPSSASLLLLSSPHVTTRPHSFFEQTYLSSCSSPLSPPL